MKRIAAIIFGGMFFAHLALAYPGEIVQIDHDNLLDFPSTFASDCSFQGVSEAFPGDPTTEMAEYSFKASLFIDFKDDSGKSRRIFTDFTGTGFRSADRPEDTKKACDEAKYDVFHQLASWNLDLTDIKKNNVSVGAEHSCEAKYFVAHLKTPSLYPTVPKPTPRK